MSLILIKLGTLIIIMLAKLKTFFQTHKNKILATISFAAAGYFFYKFLKEDEAVVKISSFM